MLIDIKRWLVNNTFSKFLGCLGKTTFSYPDQDMLNILFKNDTKYLPEQYNWRNWKEAEKELIKDNNVRIVHFTGEIKPWTEIGYCNLYHKFYSRSLWKNVPLSHPVTTRELRKFAKILFFRLHIFKAIKYQIIYFKKN